MYYTEILGEGGSDDEDGESGSGDDSDDDDDSNDEDGKLCCMFKVCVTYLVINFKEPLH